MRTALRSLTVSDFVDLAVITVFTPPIVISFSIWAEIIRSVSP